MIEQVQKEAAEEFTTKGRYNMVKCRILTHRFSSLDRSEKAKKGRRSYKEKKKDRLN